LWHLEWHLRRDVEHYVYFKWKEKGRRKDEERGEFVAIVWI
jgi:hypothetical protein